MCMCVGELISCFFVEQRGYNNLHNLKNWPGHKQKALIWFYW